MPKQHPGESKDTYISRCMSSQEARNTAPNSDHRYAMCNGMWEQAHKGIETTMEEEYKKVKENMKKKGNSY